MADIRFFTDANGLTFVNNSATKDADLFFDFIESDTVLNLKVNDRTVIGGVLIADIFKEDGITKYTAKADLVSENLSFFVSSSGGGGAVTVKSNLVKLQTEADDLIETLAYLDSGTDDERVSTIIYSSASLALTVTKTFVYAGVTPDFRVSTITLS